VPLVIVGCRFASAPPRGYKLFGFVEGRASTGVMRTAFDDAACSLMFFHIAKLAVERGTLPVPPAAPAGTINPAGVTQPTGPNPELPALGGGSRRKAWKTPVGRDGSTGITRRRYGWCVAETGATLMIRSSV
jgi:hypothetical protein